MAAMLLALVLIGMFIMIWIIPKFKKNLRRFQRQTSWTDLSL